MSELGTVGQRLGTAAHRETTTETSPSPEECGAACERLWLRVWLLLGARGWVRVCAKLGARGSAEQRLEPRVLDVGAALVAPH